VVTSSSRSRYLCRYFYQSPKSADALAWRFAASTVLLSPMMPMSIVQQPISAGWMTSDPISTRLDFSTTGNKRWNTSNSSFHAGLPTPPTGAMPGVVLGNGYGTCSASLYQQDRGLSDHSVAPHAFRDTSTNGVSAALASVSQANDTSLYNRRANVQNEANAIAPHLQIPTSVNKSKGSLAEFAAEITCLFWFETAATLQYAEDLSEHAPVLRRLLPDATPTIGFRKWVTTIISTTQVGKNVILLALMFIYRLKKFNPGVSGKRGSEFRLLTVALMLGNKFLDDNTYTNKTWAEVSGISVTEIHIMEVEFLSNMRYELYASAEEWSEWKSQLGRFAAFYQKAKILAEESRSNRVSPITPVSQSFPQKLPSPPSTHHSVGSYATSTTLNGSYPVLPNPVSSVQSLPQSPLRYQVDRASSSLERKRSADFSSEMPAAKRQLFSTHQPAQSGFVPNTFPYPSSSLRFSPSENGSNSGSASHPGLQDISRLEIPRASSSYPPTESQGLSTLAHSTRAMAGIFPSSTSSYSQPVTPISAVPQNLYQLPIPNLGDSSRAFSNYPSTHPSPSNGHTTMPSILPGLSPSYFLTNRASPYRPVRHVDTLLYPPPSTALQMPDRNLTYDQMHYQPLSKTTTERRSGPLPFFQAEGWQNSNASTPVALQAHQQFHF
jgi:hypothetical protein